MSSMIDYCTQIAGQGRDLTRAEASAAFTEIMSGLATDESIMKFLAALADKGECVEEIVGAAEVMRHNVTPVICDDPDAVDTCGTGGDGISTFNVSTAAALIAAGAGATVAKHGNFTTTRKSGSANVLQALGVQIEISPETITRCMREAKFGFLFAARLHPAMKYAAAARKKLARRTIFNLLGPLTNPAGVRRQVVGVARPELLMLIAEVLQQLGARQAMVVHGHDGLCDLTITGPSSYAELRDGRLQSFTISPDQLGLASATLDTLCIASPEESAEVVRSILRGESGPRREHTLLNAAAALVVAGRAADLRSGIALGAESIDSGAAQEVLERLIAITAQSS